MLASMTAIGMIVTGELGQLAKYLFKSILKLIGTGLKKFMAILGIDTTTLDKIIDDPIGFLNNLLSFCTF